MNYDLVFEGGGAKGMVFVGALQEFEARRHTFDRLLGTSAGAITAALLAAGYTSQEMLAALDEREGDQPVFAGFMGLPPEFDQEAIRNSMTRALLKSIDLSVIPNFIEDKLDDQLVETLMTWPGCRNFFSLVERGGWFSAHKFLSWLEQKLDTGTYRDQPRHFSGMTLAQFFAATKTELTLVATDTTGEKMLILNHHTAPDCPLVWAVRMSMSIPLLWPEVVWQADWGVYRGREITGHLIVDGGLLSNFPIELFVSNQPYVTEVMGPKQSQNILGLLIDETLLVEGIPAQTVPEATFDLSQIQTAQRINRLINTILQAHDKMVMDAFEDMIVRLPAKGYGTTEFGMSEARREALIAAGREAIREFFNRPVSFSFDSEAAVNVAGHADKIAGQMLEQSK